MNTGQIIMIVIFYLLAFIAFIKSGYSKNENIKIIWSGVILLVCTLFTALTIETTTANNKLEKQVREKCPQYEKVDSVYRLKQ